MTIKVILRQDFKDPPQRLTCDKCKSVLEYQDSDRRVEHGLADFTNMFCIFYLDCPVCKHPNELSTSTEKK